MNKLAYLQPRELDRDLESGNVILLDVRSKEEYAREHISESINIPFENLSGELHMLPVDKKLVLVCRDGHIARKAAYRAMEMGRSPYVLDGGIVCFHSAKCRIERNRNSQRSEKEFKIILSIGCATSIGMLTVGLLPAVAIGALYAATRRSKGTESR